MIERSLAPHKKLSVKWLNEHYCFVLSVVLTDSFILLNRQLIGVAKRYVPTTYSRIHSLFVGERRCESMGLISPKLQRNERSKYLKINQVNKNNYTTSPFGVLEMLFDYIKLLHN